MFLNFQPEVINSRQKTIVVQDAVTEVTLWKKKPFPVLIFFCEMFSELSRGYGRRTS